jgi:hypothetical protein
VDADAIRGRWEEILEAVKQERRVAWILLSNASVDTLQDGVLTLKFAREGEARGFAGSGYESDLKTVLGSVLGITPHIRAISAAREGDRGTSGGGYPPGTGGSAPHSVGSGGDGPRAAGSGGDGPPAAGSGGDGPQAAGSGGDGPQAAGSGGDGPQAAGAASTGSGAARKRGSEAAAGGVGGQAGAGGAGAQAGAGRLGARAGAGRAAAQARAGSSVPRAAGREADARASDPAAGGDGGGRVSEPGPDDADWDGLAGMDLIQRELGGRVIGEIGEA